MHTIGFAAWTAAYFQGALPDPCTHNLLIVRLTTISLTDHSGDKSSCPSSVKKQHNAGSEEGELDVSMDQAGNMEHILEDGNVLPTVGDPNLGCPQLQREVLSQTCF